MPVDQVLKYATQIADALARAHRSGSLDDLERTLDVSAFKGVVTSVSTYHKDGTVILEADRSASTGADARVIDAQELVLPVSYLIRSDGAAAGHRRRRARRRTRPLW